MTERALFVSHASHDSAVVQRIVDYLERQGITCWIAGRDIPPRAIYAEAIADAMKNAQACGVIVSRATNASDPVKRELELASRYKRPFIPIRVEEVEPGPGVDYYLNNVQWTEYKRDGDAALDRIVAHMKGQSYVPPPKPARRGLRLGVATVGAMALGLGGLLAVLFWPRLSHSAPREPDAQTTTTAPTPATAADIAQSTSVNRPDIVSDPTYRAITLATGFEPDPMSIAVQSGGAFNANALNSDTHNGACVGYIASPPDVRLSYTAGNSLPLILSVDSRTDTTLVVNGPDGQWYCDDDGGLNGRNPALRFPHPGSGQYDIWVGTFSNTALHDATLYVSETNSH